VTIFALMPDGSLLLSPLAAPPAGTSEGLKLSEQECRSANYPRVRDMTAR
jgi:hypothetical protein